MSWNRLQFGMMWAVAAMSLQGLQAQCGRCGDGGGTERPPGYVVTTGFRSGSPVSVPNRGGTISASVIIRSELLKGTLVPVGAGEIALSFSALSGNSTVTGLELRKIDPNNANGSLVVEPVLGDSPLTLTGSGTVRRQGELIPDSGPVQGRPISISSASVWIAARGSRSIYCRQRLSLWRSRR